MTLEQAIEQYDGYANVCMCHNLTVSQKEFKQLVTWLRELQERREKDNCYGCKHKPFEEKSYCRSCKRICLDKYEPEKESRCRRLNS